MCSTLHEIISYANGVLRLLQNALHLLVTQSTPSNTFDIKVTGTKHISYMFFVRSSLRNHIYASYTESIKQQINVNVQYGNAIRGAKLSLPL